jgi:serine/threonine protein kinase/tetratricopeptide (TPR) repeat protein
MQAGILSFLKLALPSRFEVLRRIGEGGMGVVYEALDVERDERVALKTILRHDADTIARVKHEFRALQDIHHRNLVTLRELVAVDDDVFFTMELVEGVDLLTWIRGSSRRSRVSDSPTAVDLRPSHTTDTDVELSPDGTFPPSDVNARTLTSGTFDDVRLRDAFRQVALGLSALHAAGKVHRDVKPSNVRVTSDGRVVLLDFGLIFEVDSELLTEANAVGTPAYMAPEQASGKAVGPEADWYALGVMLYEALTGRRPFEGPAASVVWAKHSEQVLPPSVFVAGVPGDLEELCLELLRVEPRARPAGDEVLRRLQAYRSDRPGATGAPFVGRDLEIRELERAFGDVGAGRAVTVLLQGESGVGKSCLVRRFLDVALSGRSDVMVLAGRCYEREAVPYKALDEVIELLSRRLARLARDKVKALLPPGADSLARIFPAMGRVPALESRTSVPDLDPLDRRRSAFRALRELLRALSRDQRVVITIDDLQWTDADSLALLQEMLRTPDAPPILLLATVRAQPHDAAAPLDLAAALPGDVRTLEVGRLAREDAQRLAEVLLAQAVGGAMSDASAIASEAEGHPLFIDELVRHAATSSGAAAPALRLDDALWGRVTRLDPASRRVLEVACVLGAPVSQDVVAHAAGVDMGELARAVSLLRATNFVRTGGARVGDAMEPFHDRVREALVARLDAEALRSCHGRIAAALELAKTSDPEVLATHWAGAGDPAKAGRYTLVAAEQAAQALAFKRSAALFERALAQLPEGDPRRRLVFEQLGDARANAGEGARAAEAFEAAAAAATVGEALELRRRAAEQLLRAGESARGLQAARKVLAAVDMSLPVSKLVTLVVLLWLRLIIRLRGLGYTPRDPREIPADVQTRLDVCWSVSFTLPYADPLVAGICHARHVLLALRAGDPGRVARALAMEASYASSSGFKAWPRAQEVLAVARTAAERSGSPHAQALVMGLGGIAACAALQFDQSVTELKEAIQRFRTQVPGSAFEVTTGWFFLFVALAYPARYGELRPLLEAALTDAVERGDTYSAVMLRLGILNSTWFFSGDIERSRHEIAEARRALPRDEFRAVHYQAIVAECYADLYDDRCEQAYERLHAALPTIRGALLLFLQAYNTECMAIRARLALACAARAEGPRREALVHEAVRLIPVVGAMPGPLGRVNTRIIRASAAHLRGKTAEALKVVEDMAAEQGADAWLSCQSARLFLGRLRKDDAVARAAKLEIEGRGGLPSRNLLRMTLPGFEAELRALEL